MSMLSIMPLIVLGVAPIPRVGYKYDLTFAHIRTAYTFAIEQVVDFRRSVALRASEELTVRVNRKESKVDTILRMEDMRGKVEVRSKAAALEFVRLRTSPMTFNLFASSGKVACEILTPADMRSMSKYGLPDWSLTDGTSQHEKGLRGMVSNREFAMCRIPKAKVHKVRHGFVVSRPIVVRESSRDGVQVRELIIKEWVGFDGAYRQLGSIGRLDIGLQWTFYPLDTRRIVTAGLLRTP